VRRSRRALFLFAIAQCAMGGCARPTPTFNHDVAPILFDRCQPCHRPGQPVPFTLMTYADAKRRAGAIAEAVEKRHMPPWLPERGGPAFVGERGLREADIMMIRRWADAGALEGNPGERPQPRSWPAGWELGRPDLVVTMPRAYTLTPGPRDVYRNVILPLNVPATKFVRAVEFRPEGAPVHHAVIRVDRGRASLAQDGLDGQPGFPGMQAAEVQDPDGHFVGWAPGRGPIVAPDGLPWRLDPATDLVVELHLLPRKTPVDVRPQVGLYFTETPPVATPVLIVMGNKAIDIPAGAADYAIEDSYVLPIDADVLSVYPHAHYLGKEMTVRAVLPGGATKTLIHIPRWSFHWQQDYRYVTPIALPRGTRITMRYTYDNSEANEDNPNHPPRRVKAGPQSSDEMGNLGVQLLPRSAADAAALAASFETHAAEVDLAGAQMLTRDEPANASHLAAVGMALNRLRRFAEAVAPLERAAQLDPASAPVRNQLAGALLAVGRTADALAQFRRAVDLSPRDAHLRYNYAKVLADGGDPAAAARELDRALALAPDFGEAHQLLGSLLFARGQAAAALDHLRRAVEATPASAAAHSDYGGALAASGRLEQAEAELRRALAIDSTYAPARDNLQRVLRLRSRQSAAWHALRACRPCPRGYVNAPLHRWWLTPKVLASDPVQTGVRRF
jgi:tetratricopeptide (TPR) repeat protein